MKFIIAVSALVAAVAAQDLSSVPPCGQMCINNMVQIANSQFGCANGDVKCYCTNAAFANGLNDCSVQACGDAVRAQVVSYGQAYCAAATGAGGGSASGSGTVTATATTTTTTGTGSGTGTAAGAGASAASSASASGSSALASAKSSASAALSSASSSIASGASSAASSASAKASGSGSSSSSAGFAMKTQAPLVGAGAIGLAALLLI